MPTKLLAGVDQKLYYNSNTNASPTWVEITKAQDVDDTLESNFAESQSRESRWVKSVSTGQKLTISFGYEYHGDGDTVFEALRAAAAAGTPTQLACLNGASDNSASEGWKAYFVLKMSMSRPLNGVATAQFEGELADYYESGAAVDPTWWEVT